MASTEATEVGTVVVIGAGMAGLAAARALHDAGVEVVVVEGRDRVGGRTHTVELEGVAVDLGAAWVHNGAGPPLLGHIDPPRLQRLPAGPSPPARHPPVVD